MSVLRKEQYFTQDPKQRELNATLMRFQESAGKMGDAIALAMTTRLRPQAEVNAAGYMARGGLFVPVATATTVLLAKPTPDTAGQPIAIYNSSGGVVLVEPVESTLNGAALGWIDAGLHLFYPTAEGWFGGFTRSVTIGNAGILEGVTTGILNLGALPASPGLGAGGILLVPIAQQGTAPGTLRYLGTDVQRVVSNTATTVRLELHALNERTATWLETGAISMEDLTTDLLGTSLWVSGADQDASIANHVETDSAVTTVSATLTTVRPGAMVLDFMANDDEADTGTAGTGQTELFDGSADSATISLQASYKSMPRPGTTTMSWSALTNTANKAHIAIVIEPARAA